MEETDKLPLKRVELSLSKFNEVAIPHHLDLLRQHRTNILKYSENGDYARVRSEQTHARRVSSQLRTLMAELESLRRRVRDEDLQRFDRITQCARDDTLRAIVDYLGIIESSCKAIVDESKAHELSIREREAVLKGWSELQQEVRALHDVWQHVHACASEQATHVSETAASVETAAVNVDEGRKNLALAEKYVTDLFIDLFCRNPVDICVR
ncbi:unnamed protein product [Diatraea saccharalis]|uniref:STX17-like N-terminal domain-containing protein n=1 Tax=Diatraea saccharalis TaxID=40085 RepID=A0A9N9R5V0_9NEOP|nr:unnamed protein product [Diatraea saccharalis]